MIISKAYSVELSVRTAVLGILTEKIDASVKTLGKIDKTCLQVHGYVYIVWIVSRYLGIRKVMSAELPGSNLVHNNFFWYLVNLLLQPFS